jgi:hypothetical protein
VLERSNKPDSNDVVHLSAHIAVALLTGIPIDSTETARGACASTLVAIIGEWDSEYSGEEQTLCALFRDIFGNPFRSVSIDTSWLSPDVVGLALVIYEDRAFDRMSILADALQEAGCENEDILNHCRQPSEHARGCWVVDLLLGKR